MGKRSSLSGTGQGAQKSPQENVEKGREDWLYQLGASRMLNLARREEDWE